MCLIVLCPKGTEKKSQFLYDAIRKSSLTNKDGIGFMYKENDQIYVDKGYTDVEEFISTLDSMELSKDGILAVHLRYGNRGGVNKEMTHPFICSNDDEEVTLLKTTTNKPVLMHNGTFMGLSLPQGKSDTFVFTHKFMSDTNINSLFYSNLTLFNEIFKSVLNVSRVLVFYPDDRDYQKTGNWFEENGYFFSNETFKNSNIVDIGGRTESVGRQGVLALSSSERTSKQETYAERQSRNFPPARMSVIPSNTSPSNNILSIRTDLLRGLVFNPRIGKQFDDSIGYTFLTYKGLYGTEDKPYINDFSSLEFFPNKYNYKYITLQAKTTDSAYGIQDNMYYKIDRILYNENTLEEFAQISRQVIPSGFISEGHYIPLRVIPKIFSIRPKNDEFSSSMFKSYLLAVALLKDHNKNIKNYLRLIKDAKDLEMITIKDKKKTFSLPAVIIKWFIYELKLHQGMEIDRVKAMLN